MNVYVYSSVMSVVRSFGLNGPSFIRHTRSVNKLIPSVCRQRRFIHINFIVTGLSFQFLVPSREAPLAAKDLRIIGYYRGCWRVCCLPNGLLCRIPTTIQLAVGGLIPNGPALSSIASGSSVFSSGSIRTPASTWRNQSQIAVSWQS